MNPDTSCTSDQWTVLSAASSHSQLAGVLGGFLITAIALLFDRTSREGVHTLALFASAVLILMLDSFVFSLMTGIQPSVDGDRQAVCVMAWTQGAVATGMLVAGTTGLFGGLGWMLASHAVNKVPDDDASDVRAFSFLAILGSWLTFAAAMTATLILSETTVDYLRGVLKRNPGTWLTVLVLASAAAVIVYCLVLVGLRTKALKLSLTTAAETTRLALRSIKVVTVSTLILAVGGSWLALSLNRFPQHWLTDPNIGFVVFVLVFSLVLPTVVSIATCYSVASTDTRDR